MVFNEVQGYTYERKKFEDWGMKYLLIRCNYPTFEEAVKQEMFAFSKKNNSKKSMPYLHETPSSVISAILHEYDIILTVNLSMIRT
jgi:hypothetical protein